MCVRARWSVCNCVRVFVCVCVRERFDVIACRIKCVGGERGTQTHVRMVA